MNAAEQTSAELLADKLVEALSRALRPSTVPIESQLWDVDAIAVWMGLSAETVSRGVVTRTGFPAPVQPTANRHAQKRWFAGEVIEWARRNRGADLPRGRGRPRATQT